MYLESHEFIEFGVLSEPLSYAHVSDEVLRLLASVHEMLGVVIVRVGTLGALHEDIRVLVGGFFLLRFLFFLLPPSPSPSPSPSLFLSLRMARDEMWLCLLGFSW